MFVIVLMSYILFKFDHHSVNEYLFLIADFLFILTAIASYVIIFYKYKRTRTQPTFAGIQSLGGNMNKNNNFFTTFVNSRFYISVLLIVSFLLFMVVPDFIYAFATPSPSPSEQHNHSSTNITEQVMSALYGISFLCDAVIYIIMQPSVRRLLWRKVYRTRVSLNLFPPKHVSSGPRVRKTAVTDVNRFDATPV